MWLNDKFNYWIKKTPRAQKTFGVLIKNLKGLLCLLHQLYAEDQPNLVADYYASCLSDR